MTETQPAIRKPSVVGLLLRAVLFSCALNAAHVVDYLQYEGFSVRAFTDVDEPYYLQQALSMAAGFPRKALYAEHAQQTSLDALLLTAPNSVIDLLVGGVAHFFQWRAVELGLALDLCCSALAYLCFALCFLRLTGRWYAAEAATVFCLLLPWVFSIDHYINIPLPVDWLVSSPIGELYLPVLRAVYTQVSYPLFALALLFGLQSLVRPTLSAPLLISGFLGGLLLYVYFFAWGSFLALFGLLCVLYPPVTTDWRSIGCWARGLIRAAVFTGVNFLAAAPGLWILSHGNTKGLVASEVFSKYWYFSIENAAVALLLLALCVGSSIAALRGLLIILFSCLVAQFALLNLQPLVGQAIAPYHFPQLFLQPVFSGVLLCTFFVWLENSSFRRVSVVLAGLCVLPILGPVRTAAQLHNLHPQADAYVRETAELSRFLSEQDDGGAVFAMMSVWFPFKETAPRRFHQRERVLIVRALSGLHLLQQEWAVFWDRKEQLRRELAMGWLYSGEVRVLTACPEEQYDFREAIFHLTWPTYRLLRANECREFAALIQEESSCQLLKDFKIDFVVFEPNLGPTEPHWLKPYGRFVWQSSSGSYRVFKLDRQAAINDLCG